MSRKKDIDCKLLQDLYIVQKLTTREIADKLNIHYATVHAHMKKCGIKGRTRKECIDVATKRGRKIVGGKGEACHSYGVSKLDEISFTKDDLEFWYIKEEWSSKQIAEKYDVSPTMILNYLRKYGIRVRTVKEVGFQRQFKVSKKVLHELYIEQEKPLVEIAKMFEATHHTVKNLLKEYEIPIRTAKEVTVLKIQQGKVSGSNHPSWKGGKWKDHQGYVHIKMPDYPRARKDGYIREHFVVWEAYNGEIPEGYHIHHLNGIKDDNRIENLCAMPSKNHKVYISTLNAKIKELEEEVQSLRTQLVQKEISD